MDYDTAIEMEIKTECKIVSILSLQLNIFSNTKNVKT